MIKSLSLTVRTAIVQKVAQKIALTPAQTAKRMQQFLLYTAIYGLRLLEVGDLAEEFYDYVEYALFYKKPPPPLSHARCLA